MPVRLRQDDRSVGDKPALGKELWLRQDRTLDQISDQDAAGARMMTIIAQYRDYFDPVAAYIAKHSEYFVGQSTGLVIGLVFGFYFGWVKWGGRSYCPSCEVLNDPWLGPSRPHD